MRIVNPNGRVLQLMRILCLVFIALGPAIVDAGLLDGVLYVGDLDTNCVIRFGLNGEFKDEFVKRGSGGLNAPGGMAIWSPAPTSTDTVASNSTREGGDFYVASTGSHEVLQFNGVNGRYQP